MLPRIYVGKPHDNRLMNNMPFQLEFVSIVGKYQRKTTTATRTQKTLPGRTNRKMYAQQHRLFLSFFARPVSTDPFDQTFHLPSYQFCLVFVAFFSGQFDTLRTERFPEGKVSLSNLLGSLSVIAAKEPKGTLFTVSVIFIPEKRTHVCIKHTKMLKNARTNWWELVCIMFQLLRLVCFGWIHIDYFLCRCAICSFCSEVHCASAPVLIEVSSSCCIQDFCGLAWQFEHVLEHLLVCAEEGALEQNARILSLVFLIEMCIFCYFG